VVEPNLFIVLPVLFACKVEENTLGVDKSVLFGDAKEL
jgi:hypothetical protein